MRCVPSVNYPILMWKYKIKTQKIKAMNFPNDLKYTKEHEWVRVEGDTMIIGITDYAQSELGDIVYVEIPTVGEQLSQGDTLGTIEAVKTVADIYMPVDGEVLEVNSELEDAPELINSDPYGKGWIVKAKIANQQQLDDLLSADQYKEMVNA